MNQRKHEEFKEPKLPKWFGFLIICAFVAFVGFIVFKSIDEMIPEKPATEHFHESKPEIFY